MALVPHRMSSPSGSPGFLGHRDSKIAAAFEGQPAPILMMLGTGTNPPATSASPWMKYRDERSIAGGAKPNAVASSAMSLGEFIRISARLSHCDSTCGWIFEGRWVESSSHRPYLRPSAAIWMSRSTRRTLQCADRLCRAEVVRLVEHDQRRCSALAVAHSCSIRSRLTASGSSGSGTR